MIIELKVPTIGESINEVTLSKWLVSDGDIVTIDQSLCEFESDKATLEFPAEKAGKITLLVKEETELKIGDVIATLDTDAVPAATAETKKEEKVIKDEVVEKKEVKEGKIVETVKEELNKYPEAELMWTQEEPRNMGAWFYIWNLMGTMIKQKVSRKSSASPATGFAKIHAQEQADLVEQSFKL